MSTEVPIKTTVLVIGGGPGGSYTAAALAREGIDTVLLEGDKFPRYHVGESMVASIRHFFRFIDMDKTFNEHGFVKKTGAAFKLNNKAEAFTDFVVASDENYAWNVIRSESDNLIFQHAGKCGAKIFDQTKVQEISFTKLSDKDAAEETEETREPGRPVSATWSRKDGSSGSIYFDYLVDASGRNGIVSTKYMKNRAYNGELKNVASWGYWRGATAYGVGTPREGQPYFEALGDGSGWSWFIPLHDGTVSIGVVMNQEKSINKKKAAGSPSSKDFYLDSIKDAKGISYLLRDARLDSEIKHASDWSYSASRYGGPYCRIVGDAGAFIDPYFSSGCHLAFSGALSAATTICASIRGQSTEHLAWDWHSKLVAERYTRFLLIVLTATKQIRHQDMPILNNADDDNFDNAFHIIRPVIQGIADISGGATQEEISRAVDYSLEQVEKKPGSMPDRAEVEQQLHKANDNKTDNCGQKWVDVVTEDLESHEARMLKVIKNVFADFFSADSYNGMAANIVHGDLGLVPAPAKKTKPAPAAVDAAKSPMVMQEKAIDGAGMMETGKDSIPKEPIPVAV